MPKESVIKHYSSSTTGSVPSAVDLVEGELAINTADEKVFFKNLGGSVVDISQSKGISGTYARLASSVSSLNGLTGARTLTGDGGAVVGVGNDTIRARLATASLTGVASFPATDFAVSTAGVVSVTGNFVRTVVVGGSTLTGNVSLTAGSNITLTPSGSTITVASSGGGGATTSAANTWTATQTFSGGINVSAGATFSGSVESSTGYRIGAGAINAQTTGYTLVAGDNGKVITLNSSSPLTLTAGTDVGTTGFSCSVIQLGAGQVTIAGSGVTLNSYSGLKIQGQHGAASIVCYATNTLNVAGNLTT